MKGPCLDLLNAETKYSSALLNLFRVLLQSADYVERLKRHYQMFRGSVEKEDSRRGGLEANRIENKRRALRDPTRRSRARCAGDKDDSGAESLDPNPMENKRRRPRAPKRRRRHPH